VHISEVSHDRIPSVDRVLKVDQVVTAKVLSVDPARRRLSLSIKALMDRPAAPAGRGGKDSPAAMPARPDDPAMAKLRAKFSASRPLKGGLS
jgi:predicted RNA-binding protein with RPS1 domain